jgi:hypothetical protein
MPQRRESREEFWQETLECACRWFGIGVSQSFVSMDGRRVLVCRLVCSLPFYLQWEQAGAGNAARQCVAYDTGWHTTLMEPFYLGRSSDDSLL